MPNNLVHCEKRRGLSVLRFAVPGLLVQHSIYVGMLALWLLWSSVISWQVFGTDIFPIGEYTALYDLYNATNGQYWEWSNLTDNHFPWQFGVPANPCVDRWEGINCSESWSGADTTYHVIGVVLPSRNLTGTLPASIESISNLETLIVGFNYLSGVIPDSVGSLLRLQHLDLSVNALTGTIPASLGQLAVLTEIVLDYNALTGPVPEWPSMPQLKFFYLSYNALSGTVPACIGNWSVLETLFINANFLYGVLPSELGRLSNLVYLDLDNNVRLTGTIPSSYGAMTKMIFFGIQNSQLSGTIPAFFGDMRQLVFIYLNGAHFTGTIPSNLGTLPALRYILLQDNHLTGTIPESLGALRRLLLLYLSDNMLHGAVPAVFSQLSYLQELSIQNNRLTGTLDGLFNYTMQRALVTLDLSNNRFTGSLPGEVFLLPALNTFVCIGSCLRGTLPAEICNATGVGAIILDSLHGSDHCRQRGLSGLNDRDLFYGTIPQCALQLPHLDTLHLSGNGLSGSLGANLGIGALLQGLDLSHNTLTGSIPASIQHHDWYSLDLSNNRFSGQLDGDFFSSSRAFNFSRTVAVLNATATGVTYLIPASQRALRLTINRLSGSVPRSIHSLLNISVISGNLFSCALDQTDLPTYDPADTTYTCSSVAFDVPNYTWMACVTLTVMAVTALWRWRDVGVPVRCVVELANAVQTINTYLHQSLADHPAVEFVVKAVRTVESCALLCAAYIVLALLPLFVACSAYYGTHTQQYTYAASAIFLSGSVAFALVAAGWLALLALLLRWMQMPAFHAPKSGSDNAVRRSSARASVTVSALLDRAHRKRLLLCAVFVTINVAVVVGVNIAFVVVALYSSSVALTVAQVALCLFKIGWNTLCAPALIRWTSHRIRTAEEEDRSPTAVVFFSLQLFVALLNNIAIPCLVVAAVDPNCMRVVMIPVPSQTARYIYARCDYYSVIGCAYYAPEIAEVAYTPQFTYSYQCSSSFITYYSPAFIFMCFATTFGTPLLLWLLLRLRAAVPKGSRLYCVVDRCTPRIWRPLSSEDAPVSRNTQRPLYNVGIAVSTVLSYLGVLLTFGAVFPPLAAALAVALVALVCYERYKIGRLLHSALALDLQPAAAVLEAECADFARNFDIQESARMLVYFCCGFYTLFLFDTLGDAVGFDGAVWVVIVVPLLPVVLFSGVDLYRYWAASAVDEAVNPPDVEMQSFDDGHAGSMKGREGTLVGLQTSSLSTVNALHGGAD